MEKTKTIDFSNRPKDESVKNDNTWGAGCPWWIFGDEKSADADMKEKFNIVDDEKKD